MNTKIGMESCESFINCQLQARAEGPVFHPSPSPRRAVTISRQSGAGAHVVAEKLADLLQRQVSEDVCHWTVFDRNLVEKVLEEHHMPGHLAKFMTEDRISEISDTLDELFGLHPPSWTLVRQTADTILHLVELGKVILIGRAGAAITRKLDYVFHVRLVASLERRVQYIQRLHRLDARAARALVRKEDLGRRRFLRKYFHRDIDDPLLYHLVINTDVVSYDEAAQMIAQAMRSAPLAPIGREPVGADF